MFQKLSWTIAETLRLIESEKCTAVLAAVATTSPGCRGR